MENGDINQRIRVLIDSAVQSIGRDAYESAIEDLKAAEVLDSDNPEVLYNLGISYAKQGLHKTAVGYYVKLLDLPLEFVDLRTVKKLLAYSLILGEEYDLALKYIAQILKPTPSDPTANSLAGFCYEKLGRIDDAIAAHRAVYAADQSNVNACNSIAYLLARKGQGVNLDEALAFARKALESSPENPAYCDTVGFVYMKRNQPELAKKFLKMAIEKAPSNVEIRSHLNELLKI